MAKPSGRGAVDQAGTSAQPIEIDGGSEPNTATPACEGGGASQLWGHAVRASDLCPGDQIYIYRRGGIQHHGIVTHAPWAHLPTGATGTAPHLSPNDVQVVHFDSACDGVETRTLESFTKGATLRRAKYSASRWSASTDIGATYGCSRDDPAVIVMRATEAAKFGQGVSGWSGYSLLTNNCETFAFWCSTGRRQTLSRQASRGLIGAGVVAAGASAVASAGGLTSAGLLASSMLPRGVRGVQQTVKVVEWATGVAVVAISVADVVTTLVTRDQVERNRRGVEA